MKQVYLGALELVEDTIHNVGLLIGKSYDEWSIKALQTRMSELHALKRAIELRAGIRSNVIHVDFQLKRKVS